MLDADIRVFSFLKRLLFVLIFVGLGRLFESFRLLYLTVPVVRLIRPKRFFVRRFLFLVVVPKANSCWNAIKT